MGSNLVIAAIPDENDRVWKVSSEKIPHLTVLFLGETKNVSNLEQILLFVEHAASTTLNRFYLPVDRRGELGADKADVLFFKKARYDFKAISEFRDMLLQDQNIKTAYDSATQFEGPWNPHLTLGYPDTPAKSLPDDTPFYDVPFNKIAVWTGDFEGPDFLLKDYWEDLEPDWQIPMDVAMSDLEHHGIKGMHWGIRTKEVHPDIADVPKKIRKEASTDAEEFTRAKLYYGEGAGTRRKLIKAKVEAKKKDPLYAKAFDHFAAQTDLAKRADQAHKERKRTDRKTATKKAVRKLNRGESLVHPVVMDVNRAVVKGLRDASLGHVDDQEVSMAQTADLGAEFLSHHGVKGQKWGVRKVEGGGGQAHIRINQKTGQAALSTESTLALVGTALVMPPLLPFAFLSPRIRSEFSAARAVNKGVQADKKWQKELKTAKRAVEIHNTASDEINKKIPDFNNDQRWKGVDLNKNPAKMKEYNTAVERELMNPAYANAAVKVHGTSPTGRYKFEIKDSSTALLKLTDTTKVEHAAGDNELFVQFKILRDDNGHILGFEPTEDDTGMAQTVDLALEFLEHHGVKGQKWGVRRAAAAVGRGIKRVGRGLAALGAQLNDSAWQSSTYSDAKHEAVHNHVAKELDNHVERLQRSPKYRGKDLKADSDLRKTYYQDVAKVSSSAYRRAVKETYGENYTGTKTAHYVTDARGPRIEVRDKATKQTVSEAPLSSMRDIRRRQAEALNPTVSHAGIVDAPDLEIKLTLDSNGQISGVGFVQPEKSLTQTADLGAEFLEHYGILGMHWGVRKAAAVTTQSHIDAGIVKRQTKIKTKGGESHPPTHDAIKAAVNKQKLKKSGMAALSNQELKDLQTRLQLETQVQQLTSSKGQKAVQKTLEEEGKQQLSRGVRKGTPHALKKARKGAATVATTAALAL